MFNRQNVSELTKLVQDKLNQEVKGIGLQVMQDGGSYSDGEFNMKLKFVVTEMASGESYRQYEFKRMASWYGLSGDDFGKKFISDHREYTICGISPSAKKYPILATRDDGVEFKFPAHFVKNLLGA